MPEISREVTLKAQKEGIDQLFLSQPLLFSQLLLEGREQQYLDAKKLDTEVVFFDRGIPDVHAYMNYLKTDYPPIYKEKSKKYIYDKIFLFEPWKEIYVSDNERYERSRKQRDREQVNQQVGPVSVNARVFGPVDLHE